MIPELERLQMMDEKARQLAALYNAAKMREALERIMTAARVWREAKVDAETVVQHCHDIAAAALAEPPRNCDVGTAKEQHERHLKFCDEHARYMRCSQCPAGSNNIVTCHFTWMQMPYEEGGAE